METRPTLLEQAGFERAVLGLSGGIDSASCAAIAADGLGPERVWCVMLPSPFTSQDSLDDAAECARLLGCRLDTVRIEPAMTATTWGISSIDQRRRNRPNPVILGSRR